MAERVAVTGADAVRCRGRGRGLGRIAKRCRCGRRTINEADCVFSYRGFSHEISGLEVEVGFVYVGAGPVTYTCVPPGAGGRT
ncbi:MAG TPA: hypothetical protein VN253_13690, partial [Kofleriaceae bacterium]|nr:hypothetical protein [Kofleriaceae bacterium]